MHCDQIGVLDLDLDNVQFVAYHCHISNIYLAIRLASDCILYILYMHIYYYHVCPA